MSSDDWEFTTEFTSIVTEVGRLQRSVAELVFKIVRWPKPRGTSLTKFICMMMMNCILNDAVEAVLDKE